MNNIYKDIPACGLRLQDDHNVIVLSPLFKKGFLNLWAAGRDDTSSGFDGVNIPLTLRDAIDLRNALTHAIYRRHLR